MCIQTSSVVPSPSSTCMGLREQTAASTSAGCTVGTRVQKAVSKHHEPTGRSWDSLCLLILTQIRYTHVGHLVTDTKTKEIIALGDITGKVRPNLPAAWARGKIGARLLEGWTTGKTGSNLLPIWPTGVTEGHTATGLPKHPDCMLTAGSSPCMQTGSS